MSFDKLEKKIKAMVQHYEVMKRNTENFETQLHQKEQETSESKNRTRKSIKRKG